MTEWAFDMEAAWRSLDVESAGRAKVKFKEEKQVYTVRAANERFAICTKPLNLAHTVLYTIIDWAQQIRGTENLVFGFGAETDEQCAAMLERLTTGDTQVSHRNRVPLRIEQVIAPIKRKADAL